VAIDGPSASGKSTVSRTVAAELGFTYVDSGALYRGITWKVWQDGVDATDAAAVIALLDRIEIEFFEESHAVRFRIDGVDPGQAIRSEPVVERVSDVAAIPEVRAYVVAKLQGMAGYGKVVMEGRDIGTVVFIDTPYKFYLDADPAERARRRHLEMTGTEAPADVHSVLDSLQRRDQKDTTRKTAPLQIAAGARVINTTSMSIDEVVRVIVSEIRAAGVGA
jgi:cytidylate kinase